jgi:adenylate cyclase
LHGAVARAIEERAGDRLDEQAGLLARHWEAAGEALTAARWHVRASRWAGMTQSAETLRHLRCAVDLVVSVESTEESRALEATALAQLLWLGPRAGHLRDAEHLAERARELSLVSTDPQLRARLAYGIANWELFGKDDLAGGSERLDEAIALADACGDTELRIGARYSQGLCGFLTGRIAAAIGHFESALEIAEAHPEINSAFMGYSHVAALHAFLAVLEAQRGRCREASARSEAALESARTSDLAGRVVANGLVAVAATFAGEPEKALARGQRAVELCEPISARNIRGIAMSGLAHGYIATEQWAEAAEAHGRLWTEGIVTQRMFCIGARAQLEIGSADLAIAGADEVIALCTSLGGLVYECHARLDLADTLVRMPSPPRDRIEQELARCAELIEQTGALVFRPMIHEVRARLDPARREAELGEALRLYREMESGHVERIETELAQ